MPDFKSSLDASAKSAATPERVGASTANQVRGQYNTATTGILTGGVGAPSGIDPATFMVAAGEGWIRDSTSTPDNPVQVRVVWDAIDEIAPLNLGGPGAGISFVWMEAGAVVDGVAPGVVTQTQPSDYPDPGTVPAAEYRSKVFLGFVVYEPFLGVVLAFVSNVRPALNVAAQLGDLTDAIGSIKTQNAAVRGLASLSLEQDAGQWFALGAVWANPGGELVPNILNQPAISPLLGGRGQRSGLSDGRFTVAPGPPVTTLDPALYDDGSGTPAAVPSGYATIQRIYFNPVSPGHLFLYGQNTYQCLTDAHQDLLHQHLDDIPQLRAEGWVLTAQVALLESATDLTDNTEALVYNALPSGDMSHSENPPISAPSALHGTCTNFPQGGGSVCFANFGSETTPGAGAVTLPVDVFVVGAAYTYSSTSALSTGVGDAVALTVGTFTPGSALTDANYTAVAGTEITWDDSDNGTFPVSTVDLSSASVKVAAGTPIGARSVETGTVNPSTSDLLVTVWIRPC